jgi:glycerol-3-phosphate O-acyltransferase
MILARPVAEAENRLARFHSDKGSILDEVERRVVQTKLAAAGRGSDASLEYVLNDVAFQEIRRLEKGMASSAERKRVGRWHELARKLGGMSDEEKRQRLAGLVRTYAEDVCGHFDARVYRFATGILPALLSGVLQPRSLTHGLGALGDLTGKVIIEGPLEHIRACADRGTLVVTPTHSSNMDSVVIGWSLHRAGLPPVTYGAGKNLFSNPFISFFMHNLGAYRVDRRIGNALYKDVLKTYAQVLLERGYHSLFFPGGTRSRSGAVEKKLKLGLLSTTVSAYEHNVTA